MPRWSEQVADAGLNLRVGRVGSEFLKRRHHQIDALLLGVENDNCNGEQGADGEHDNARRSPEACPENNRKCRSTLAAVEKNSQRPGQHDADKRDRANEDAEHAGLEGSANGNSAVHSVYGQNGPIGTGGLGDI